MSFICAFDQWPTDNKDWPVEEALTALTMDVIMRVIFSSDIGNDVRSAELAVRTVIGEANSELFWPVSSPNFMPWKRSKLKALGTLNNLIDPNVQSRISIDRSTWPDDLLSILLQLHQQGTVTWPLDAVRDECMTAFLAGLETVAATLTWWSWCMASNPSAPVLNNTWAPSLLNANYAASKFPVPYYEAQLSFSAEKIKVWYAFLIHHGTLAQYVHTQHIDSLFILSTLLMHGLVLTLVSRLFAEHTKARKVLVICALIYSLAPIADQLESLVSYVMLVNPTEFPAGLAYAYSSFSALKFAM